MYPYNVCTEYVEIMAGTANKTSPAYMEAAGAIEKHTPKGKSFLRNFLTSIASIAGKAKPKMATIHETKGNLKSFKGYENITKSFNIIKKYAGSSVYLDDLKKIHDGLLKYQDLYAEAYDMSIEVATLEYETAADVLITGCSMLLSQMCGISIIGENIKVEKKEISGFSMLTKLMHDYAAQLSSKNHKTYLEGLIESKKLMGHSNGTMKTESTEYLVEGTIIDSIEIFNIMMDNIKGIGSALKNIIIGAKNSIFGILPLIRAALYMRFKRKADTVLELEQQVFFIEQNIEQLKKRTNMDEKQKIIIIKKQEAVVEAYKKKAEKLRAELIDSEREASKEIEKEDPKLKKDVPVDDDFVLESLGIDYDNADNEYGEIYEDTEFEEDDDDGSEA